ncbi:MAG: glycosyltransferase [Pseudomonadales bacterium]
MSERPAVSCIVPVYNGARFIDEALQSIVNQTCPVAEVIVVDDGSTDATAEVVHAWRDQVTYVRKDNGGPASARNLGIHLSASPFLAFLDADDLWHPEKLERQMRCFVERPDLELCLTYKRTFWVEGMREEGERLRREGHPFAEDHPGYVCQTMLMPRTTFQKVGPFDDSLRIGEDTDWLLRAERLGVVREILPDVLVFRRMHQDNLSYTRYDGGAQDQLKLLFAHIRSRRGGSSAAGA